MSPTTSKKFKPDWTVGAMWSLWIVVVVAGGVMSTKSEGWAGLAVVLGVILWGLLYGLRSSMRKWHIVAKVDKS